MVAKETIVGETRLRVRYAETDKMGVVYHSNFVIWFEVGRVELLRQLGFQYKEMESEDNCHIPVVDLRVRYKAPAQYDDEIVVRTQIKNVRSSLLHFSYEIFRESDRTLLATGETMHIIVDNKLERTALPEKYMQAFNGLKPNS
ncbi:MAG TPA: thioesterase family protein [Candidatus Angelobacter sp.]|jgi:acyl-CoA thioester hydrolase|nr:thioesterase family protein [Candidatus Angelobacter sp.]